MLKYVKYNAWHWQTPRKINLSNPYKYLLTYENPCFDIYVESLALSFWYFHPFKILDLRAPPNKKLNINIIYIYIYYEFYVFNKSSLHRYIYSSAKRFIFYFIFLKNKSFCWRRDILMQTRLEYESNYSQGWFAWRLLLRLRLQITNANMNEQLVMIFKLNQTLNCVWERKGYRKYLSK